MTRQRWSSFAVNVLAISTVSIWVAGASLWYLRAQTPHPCDTTPTSPTTILVGQPFTFGWCHSLKDLNGNPTTLSGYEVYRNSAPFASVPISAQSQPNADGLVYVSIQQTELAPGPVQWEVTAINAQGESARGGPLPLIITVAPAIPVSPSKLRLSVP